MTTVELSRDTIPTTMRALRVNELADDFAGCAVETIAVPSPGPGEALVRIRACSVGFPDLLMTRGAYQHKPAMPFTPGSDIAGDVVAVGEGVSNVKPGDAVVATALGGGFGQYAVFNAEVLRPKPASLDYPAASAFGAAYLTAYVSLVRRAQMQPGEWVLVHGASGGVGLAAVDLAKALGARVIAASASDDKLATVASEYAVDATVNISNGFKDRVKEITGGAGADIVYDPVGGDVFDESVRCIAFNGRLLVIGFTSGRLPTLQVNLALIKGFSVVGVRAGEFGRRFPELGRENMKAIWDLAESGKVRPRVHAVVPLSAWRDGFKMMESRSVVGRVVIVPDN